MLWRVVLIAFRGEGPEKKQGAPKDGKVRGRKKRGSGRPVWREQVDQKSTVPSVHGEGTGKRARLKERGGFVIGKGNGLKKEKSPYGRGKEVFDGRKKGKIKKGRGRVPLTPPYVGGVVFTETGLGLEEGEGGKKTRGEGSGKKGVRSALAIFRPNRGGGGYNSILGDWWPNRGKGRETWRGEVGAGGKNSLRKGSETFKLLTRNEGLKGEEDLRRRRGRFREAACLNRRGQRGERGEATGKEVRTGCRASWSTIKGGEGGGRRKKKGPGKKGPVVLGEQGKGWGGKSDEDFSKHSRSSNS